jgi:hypothetical protein
MEIFGFSALFGLLLGFLFGVGCAAAVLYTIYNGGYRKAVEDSQLDPQPEKFVLALEAGKVSKSSKSS